MRAIVLSCDKYRALAEHMIFQYNRLWPQHPFRFRIPYQEIQGEAGADREYRQCPKPIKATVLKLLEDLEDEEWIYWCLDDKYPIEFDLPKVEAMTRFVCDGPPSVVSAVLFCRCRHVANAEHLTGEQYQIPDGQILLRRKQYHQIWIHQFLRVKVIRHLFQQFPDEIPQAMMMDDLKDKLFPPESHGLYVTQENFAVFGESTVSGKVTANCLESMAVHGMATPELLPLGHYNVMGKIGDSKPAPVNAALDKKTIARSSSGSVLSALWSKVRREK